ncbi:hypothetical protein A11A3_05931 [Alcanivorax hongdengensis A-11-3]|uniref:Uncharacterized protein n=1 Tax=Alcanivorax hongdengensis A-11-3 TaxID=1177179 RepID=L0WE24_9GAMM|nr:hypothetical protein A11A3_05931 [Alcanivorax hongdengensis A-11-3]
MGADTTSACLSMLKIMDGRSSVGWTQSEPDDADVLFVAHDGGANRKHWENGDKPCVVVYHNTEARPAARYTLPHPFRVMQLIGVLEDISSALGDTASATRAKAPADKPQDETFGHSLKNLLEAPANDDSLYRSRGAQGHLYVAPASGCYYIDPGLHQQLRSKDLSLSALEEVNDPISNQLARRPIFELAWFTAQHAHEALAPWLAPAGQFKLKRWPNFGTVRSDRVYLSLCALLTRQACGREQLLEHAQCNAGQLDRFLSACSMSNLLISDSNAPAPAPQVTNVNENGRFGSLIRGLRSRLGLSS